MAQPQQRFDAPPRTRATTTIGILKAVVKAIREEPRRYDQGDWICRFDEYNMEWIGADRLKHVPACGTIGCVAGWVDVLKRDTPIKGGSTMTVPERARALLGLNEWQTDLLFSGGALDGLTTARPGTRAYANAGVKHIERFMRKELGYKGPKL